MASLFQTNRPHAVYASLALLLAAILFGGASRLDAGTTIIARLAALFALGYLLWRRQGSPIRIEWPALVFWVLLIAVPLAQLIPLPWSVWTMLPGRALPRELFDAIHDHPSMPVSLAPDRTLDFALALVVPLAAYILGSHLDYFGRSIILRAVAILALIGAFVGLLQLTFGPHNFLYFYSITNDDSSVGFFSNANHLALFLAAGIAIVVAWLGDRMAASGRIVGPSTVAAGVAIVVLLVGVAGTGSRAGAIFAAIALLAGQMMLPFRKVDMSRSYIIGASVAMSAVLATVLTLVLNGTILAGKFKLDEVDRARTDLIPVFRQMMQDFFPFGSGLGSFEPVFQTYESSDTLAFNYLNQAHNDYAQIVIEAGIAGVILIGAFLLWYFVRVVRIWYAGDDSSSVRRQQAVAALVMAMMMLHSAADYPMRTAAMAAVFGFLAAFLTPPPSRRNAEIDASFPRADLSAP